MKIDPNHDIVPTLRMFDGLLMNKAADEIARLRKREYKLMELLRSAHSDAGIGNMTARTCKVLFNDSNDTEL
jgi:hypothetical protein